MAGAANMTSGPSAVPADAEFSGRPQAAPGEGQKGEAQGGEGAPAQERPHRPEGGKPRFEGRRDNRRFEGKFDGKKREGPGSGQAGGDRPPHHEKRPPREKQADPDSPFAKLAALKAELEAKGKKS